MTPEQINQRLGRFTASEIYKLMGEKGIGKTGETYIFEKAAEFLTGQPSREEFTSQATDWGNSFEGEARLYFEAATGVKLKDSSTLDNGEMLATPDATAEDDSFGFEVKCPFNSANHLKNLTVMDANGLLKLRPEYYYQCVGGMWVTGIYKWKFCSYDPRFKEEKRMLILNIELNPEHLQLLKNRITEAKKIFDSIISKL